MFPDITQITESTESNPAAAGRKPKILAKKCLPAGRFSGRIGTNGAIAQLGERLHGMQEVVGSNPIGSIIATLCFISTCLPLWCLLLAPISVQNSLSLQSNVSSLLLSAIFDHFPNGFSSFLGLIRFSDTSVSPGGFAPKPPAFAALDQ